MARIKDESVEAVKAAANIVDLVEARTRLRKVGGRYTGLCPFHEEKTPSFSVSPDRGTYHCFGCGVGGDAISFVRETESLDFVGAIEWLADRFHVPIEYEESSPHADAQRRRRDRLHELLEQATAYYERVLWDSKLGEPVRAYLASRGLGEETCREFRLGLSPQGATLARKAREKFSTDELASAGLVTRRGTDYFQRRLMFPLADPRGRVIGFQARKLHEDDPLRGKYVNSPEGELFRKSNVLYGLHLARGAISKEDRAVVVEGNTDVIALRQAGLSPAVASMGTALTERQLKELGRLTSRVYLCFDSDSAGEDATLRGMELAIRQGLDVRVVALPRGKDPADDPSGFEARLADADPYAVHRVRLELARARDRQHAYLQVQEVLNGIPESPERHDAWRLANDRLGLTVELRAVAAGPRAPAAPSRRGSSTPVTSSSGTRSRESARTRRSCGSSPSSVLSTSTRSSTSASGRCSSTSRRRTTSSCRCWRSSTRWPSATASTRRRPSSSSCDCANVTSGASSRAPTTRSSRSSSTSWPRSALRSASSPS